MSDISVSVRLRVFNLVCLPVSACLLWVIATQDPPKYGPAYGHFGGGPEGKEACEALYALSSMSSTDNMVSSFLQPLQVCSHTSDRSSIATGHDL